MGSKRMTKKNLIYEYEKKLKQNEKQKIILISILVILVIILLYKYNFIKMFQGNGTYKDEVKIIKVSDQNGEIETDTELDIFSNDKFNKPIIVPSSSGKYQFIIENSTEKIIKYDIKLTDEMSNPINMKYRLKLDNIYICGKNNKYVSIEELNIEEIVVMQNSRNIYTLEWYWEDNDETDTYIGSLDSDEYYRLKLDIKAEEYIYEEK